MLEDLPQTDPPAGINVKDLFDEAPCFLRDGVLHGVPAILDQLVELVHVPSLEGHGAIEHGVQDD